MCIGLHQETALFINVDMVPCYDIVSVHASIHSRIRSFTHPFIHSFTKAIVDPSSHYILHFTQLLDYPALGACLVASQIPPFHQGVRPL